MIDLTLVTPKIEVLSITFRAVFARQVQHKAEKTAMELALVPLQCLDWERVKIQRYN